LEKFECLARIQDGAGNWILPDKFIQAAKTARLYPRITREVIRKACELFQNSAFEFSVNISVEDILNPGTLAFMYETAKNFNSPGRLCFEILESEGMEGLPEIWQFVKNVKNLGCKFAVDDFGSGYSNFDHILKLEVDYLKIDSSLVKNIYSDTNSFIIVQTIQSFADKLGIKTIAEHVHTEDVQKCIRQLGVNFSQGFFLGRPEEPAIYNL
jgi:EAL domain-containing protein (putative c-di-GMP-specific phosphodiesterase class I)